MQRTRNSTPQAVPSTSGRRASLVALTCIVAFLHLGACNGNEDAQPTLRELNTPTLAEEQVTGESAPETARHRDAIARVAGALPNAHNESLYRHIWPPTSSWPPPSTTTPPTDEQGGGENAGHAPSELEEEPASHTLRAPEGESILIVAPVWGEEQQAQPQHPENAALGWIVVTLPSDAAGASGLGAALPRLREGTLSTWFYPRDPTSTDDVDREGSIDPIDEIEAIEVAWGLGAPDEERVTRAVGIRTNNNRLFEVCLPGEWTVNSRGERTFGHRCATFLRAGTAFSRLDLRSTAVSARNDAARLAPGDRREHFRWIAANAPGAPNRAGEDAQLVQIVRTSVPAPNAARWSCSLALEWEVSDQGHAAVLPWEESALTAGLRAWLESANDHADQPEISVRDILCALKVTRLRGGGLTSRSTDWQELEHDVMRRLFVSDVEAIGDSVLPATPWERWGWFAALAADLVTATGGILEAPEPNALVASEEGERWRQISWRATGYTLAPGARVAWRNSETIYVPTRRGARSCGARRCAVIDAAAHVAAEDPDGRVRFLGARREPEGGATIYITSTASGRTCERSSFCEIERACNEVSYSTLRRPHSLLGPSFARVPSDSDTLAAPFGSATHDMATSQVCAPDNEWTVDGFDGWSDTRTLRFVRHDNTELQVDTYTGNVSVPSAQNEGASETESSSSDDRRLVMRSAGASWSLWLSGAAPNLVELSSFEELAPEYGANRLLGAYVAVAPDGERIALQLGNRLLGVWEREGSASSAAVDDSATHPGEHGETTTTPDSE